MLYLFKPSEKVSQGCNSGVKDENLYHIINECNKLAQSKYYDKQDKLGIV